MLPSGVNDTMRDMMAQIRDCGDGIRGGTYTMTAPVITGGSITGITFTSIVVTGGSITGITDLAVADGGTGASPISSIKHAGLPWELGLAETHQTLVKNKLRSRVVVQADGQMKTARDIVVATLLGAEEWGVATAALVVEGCIMMRKCHLNTCPVGVATQDPELRKRFTGDADHVVNFFRFMVQELREVMASLGFRTVDEMVGRVDSLQLREVIDHWKYSKLDLSPLLYQEPSGYNETLYCSEEQDHGLSEVLDWQLIEKAKPALDTKQKVTAEFPIKNTDRTVGTMLSN
jgi:glutamate synthase (NADPH/NADH) large chain